MATPVKIESKKKGKFVVTGNKKVDTSLISNPKIGDWLLCHGELAINKISKKEADNIFGLIKQCPHDHVHSH